MPLPTSFEDTQKVAEIMQTLVDTNRTDIYLLLLSCFFYCQLWFIPVTWVFGLLIGACMPSIIESGGVTHLINLVGVALNFYMSRIFLTKLIAKSERMRENLAQIEDKMTQMGSDQIVFGMIGLRVFPGSPNPLYNMLFPQIPSITLGQNLMGVLVGQLPYNICVVKAGQMIRKIHSRSEIIDSATMAEFLLIAIIFMLPVLLNKVSAGGSRKNEKSGLFSHRSREEVSTGTSTLFDSQSDDEEEMKCLIAEKRVIKLQRGRN